jgi:peptidoglycan/xylan/chitin deacetylase (PgdA/CDA1 family)
MHLYKSIAFALSLAVVSTTAFAHDPDNFYNHEEMGTKLDPDSMFCDYNNDGDISPIEIRKTLKTKQFCRPTMEMQEKLHMKKVFSTKPIANFDLGRGQLVLTIDDGPNPRVTRNIIALLDQYHIKATLFVVGSLAERYPDIIRELVAHGHTVGNHTYSHDVPHITAETIKAEILRADKALTTALGHPPQGRKLFRAPGLGWSEPKALTLNDGDYTSSMIGPIHANLGTDAPRADWSCWSRGATAKECADMYFHDIVNGGKGVILSHDIYFKEGRGNTYEMLKILLARLDTEAGGIKNKDGTGVWEFMDLPTLHVLDKYDHDKNGKPGSGSQPAPAPAPQKTSDGYNLITTFFNGNVNVRTELLANESAPTADSLLVKNGATVKTANLVAVADLNKDLTVDGKKFKLMRIEKAASGFESLVGTVVYIYSAAF